MATETPDMKTLPFNPRAVDDDILLFCAMRYALGRRSYVTSAVTAWIIRSAPLMTPVRRAWYVNEIQPIIDAGHAGENMDVQAWKNVLKALKEQP